MAPPTTRDRSRGRGVSRQQSMDRPISTALAQAYAMKGHED